MGIVLAYVVKVDDRGRIKLPKDIAAPGDRFLIIPVGKRIVLLKIPPKPIEASSSWLHTEKDKRELRFLAESQAIKEIEDKLKRRGLLIEIDAPN
jgi:bifunctional DNA-binding transcriptional regulator/antitoxin component of YhaV-PrlF toxin-antitoxin module